MGKKFGQKKKMTPEAKFRLIFMTQHDKSKEHWCIYSKIIKQVPHQDPANGLTFHI